MSDTVGCDTPSSPGGLRDRVTGQRSGAEKPRRKRNWKELSSRGWMHARALGVASPVRPLYWDHVCAGVPRAKRCPRPVADRQAVKGKRSRLGRIGSDRARTVDDGMVMMSDDHDHERPRVRATDGGSCRDQPAWLLPVLCWRAREVRAVTVAAVLAVTGWLVRIVDLDLFSPDSAADLEVDLYAAAALVSAYAFFSASRRLLVSRGRPQGQGDGTSSWQRSYRRSTDQPC